MDDFNVLKGMNPKKCRLKSTCTCLYVKVVTMREMV